MTRIQPPSVLWQTALSMTFSTIRAISAWLPVTQAPPGSLVVLHGQPSCADRGCLVGQRIGRHVVERQDRLAGQAAVLRAGQDQERLEQPVDLVQLRAQPRGQRDRLRRSRLGLGQRHVQRGPHRGQRRAQLMRGVGDEPALGLERDLQPFQQAVDGVAKLLQLVLRALNGQPLVQVVLGDALRRRGHLAHRAQRAPGYQPAQAPPTPRS